MCCTYNKLIAQMIVLYYYECCEVRYLPDEGSLKCRCCYLSHILYKLCNHVFAFLLW